MHPICYFRTDNIHVMGPFPAPDFTLRQLAAAARIDSAGHDELDDIAAALRVRDSGRRYNLKIRRARLHHAVAAIRRRAQEHGFNRAKRAAFIGPLTIAQKNGHPF